jgi:hypothetical protein
MAYYDSRLEIALSYCNRLHWSLRKFFVVPKQNKNEIFVAGKISFSRSLKG